MRAALMMLARAIFLSSAVGAIMISRYFRCMLRDARGDAPAVTKIISFRLRAFRARCQRAFIFRFAFRCARCMRARAITLLILRAPLRAAAD